MKKALLIGGCVVGGVLCVGGIIKKHRKLEKAFDDAIDKKDLEEARKMDKEIKIFHNNIEAVLNIAIAALSLKMIFIIADQLKSNREFNELNFTMILCHILDTDDSIDNSDKLNMINKIIDSGKFGEKAVEILKDNAVELMGVE